MARPWGKSWGVKGGKRNHPLYSTEMSALETLLSSLDMTVHFVLIGKLACQVKMSWNTFEIGKYPHAGGHSTS